MFFVASGIQVTELMTTAAFCLRVIYGCLDTRDNQVLLMLIRF